VRTWGTRPGGADPTVLARGERPGGRPRARPDVGRQRARRSRPGGKERPGRRRQGGVPAPCCTGRAGRSREPDRGAGTTRNGQWARPSGCAPQARRAGTRLRARLARQRRGPPGTGRGQTGSRDITWVSDGVSRDGTDSELDSACSGSRARHGPRTGATRSVDRRTRTDSIRRVTHGGRPQDD